MKKSDKQRYFVAGLVGTLLLAVLYYHDDTITNIQFSLLKGVPQLSIVFDEGINFEDYDGAVILNCLHGGGCPEGVHLTDDETGEIIETEIVPKKAEPVTQPEDPNAPPDPSLFDDSEIITISESDAEDLSNKLDVAGIAIYGIIIAGLGGVIAWLLLKKKIGIPKALR